jgi:DNA gyrase/topoisomerase IV subunit A
MAKKIKKDQLEKLQAVVTEINNITLEVGKLESNKHKMLHALNQSEQTLSVIQKELQDDYGNKIVDIKTGELKDEPAQED